MKRVVLTVVWLLFIAYAARVHSVQPLDDQVAVTQEYVDALNRQPSSWKASTKQGRTIEGATIAQAKKLLGARRHFKNPLPPKTFEDELASSTPGQIIPTEFDAGEKWKRCPTITTIRDQSACGSCWAIAAVEAMSDRYCVSGKNDNLPISTLNLMTCCENCGDGCDGGFPEAAWQYWVNTGLVTEKCQPYPFPKCEHHIPAHHYPVCPSSIYPTPSCKRQCNSSSSYTLYRGKKAYSLEGELKYQRELLVHGPFEVAFDVYKDFLSYKSGVYVQRSDDYLGGHAVKAVGWGVLNGTKYWKIANSWNEDWGDKGYFLILRGKDECGIESSGAAGLP